MLIFFFEFLKFRYRQAYELESMQPAYFTGQIFTVNDQERCPLDSGSKMGRVTTMR